MGFGVFTFISGIASLLGLVLQLCDVFPEHRELRKSIFLVVFGVFLGNLLGMFRLNTVKADIYISAFTVLIGAFFITSSILVIGAAFTKDQEHRKSIFTASGWWLFLTLMLLLGNVIFMAVYKALITASATLYARHLGNG